MMIFSYNHARFDMLLKFTTVIARIVKILMYFALGVLLLGVGVIAFLPQGLLTFDLSQIDLLTIELINVQVRLPNTILSGEVMLKGSVITALIAAMFFVAFAIIIIHLLEGILIDVHAKRPFSENNVQRLFKMAVAFIVAAVLLPLVMLAASWQLVHTLDLDATVNYGLHSEWLFTGLLIYLLASIFQYGKHLQDEVDQTV